MMLPISYHSLVRSDPVHWVFAYIYIYTFGPSTMVLTYYISVWGWGWLKLSSIGSVQWDQTYHDIRKPHIGFTWFYHIIYY